MARITEQLDAVLAECALDALAAPAREWCTEEGASFLFELVDHLDGFAEALQLKAPEKQQLAAALERRLLPQVSEFMHVKNTFLDLDDGPRLLDIQRSKTEPYRAGRACLEESDGDGADDGDEDVDEDIGNDEDAGVVSPAANLDIYKTKTCDGYEPTYEWSWAHGDPSSACPGPAAQADTVMVLDPQCAPESVQFGAVMPTIVGMWLVPVGRFDRLVEPPEPGLALDPAVAPAPAPAPSELLEPQVSRATVLQRAFSVTSSTYRIRWTVDARRLKTTDREAVSPIFELSFAGSADFRLVLKPKSFHSQRGGASFKKSQGKGTVELKCLSDIRDLVNPVVTFRLAVGSGTDPRKQQRPRGPVQHDFRERPICGLLEGKDEWDFSRAVDKPTMTFVVCLELFPGGGPAR